MEPEKQQIGTEFEAFKKSLGTSVSKYTDEQLHRMRIALDGIADTYFDIWLEKTKSKAHNVKDDQAHELIDTK
jgi:truncated hemoglobin YjbI